MIPQVLLRMPRRRYGFASVHNIYSAKLIVGHAGRLFMAPRCGYFGRSTGLIDPVPRRMSITAASGSSGWSRRRSDSTISTSFVLGFRAASTAASPTSGRRPTLFRHREIIAAVEARNSSGPTGSSFGTAAAASWNLGMEMSGIFGISM